jgi:hypothetical protein
MADVGRGERAIKQRLAGGVFHGEPRLGADAFHLAGGAGDQLIRPVRMEEREFDARGTGIDDEQE